MPARLYLIIWSRTLIGLLLTAAGILKMTDLASFRATVRGFALVPEKFTFAVGSVLPILEALTGLVILVAVVVNDAVLRWGCINAIVLFFLFGMAVAINLARGRRDISCGCFSAADEDGISWLLVIRNAVLGVVAFLGFASVHGASWREPGYSTARLNAALFAVFFLLACTLCFAIHRLWGYGRDLIPRGGSK